LQSPSFGQLYAGTGAGGFTFRGLNQQRTLVLLDGQPLQDAATSGVNFRVAFMPEVSRVEVVPGAFSSLYGSSAIGGVINIITKQPDSTGGNASFRQAFGNADSTQGDAYAQHRRGRLGIAGGAGYSDNRSYITEFVVRQPAAGAAGTTVTGAIPTITREGVASFIVGDKNRSPWREKRATAKASFNLTDVTRINGGVVYSDSLTRFTRFNSYLRDANGNEVSSGTLGINGQRVTLTESNFVTSAPLQEAATRVYAGLQTLLNDRIPLTLSVARISRENNFSTVGTGSTWTGGVGAFTTTPNANVDANAVVTLPVGRSLVAGVSYHQDSMTRLNQALSNWRDKNTVTSTNNGSEGDTTMMSAFGQQELALSNALTVYAGARLDRWSTEGTYIQNTAPVSKITYAKRAVTSVSPKVSAVYRPVSPLTLRGSIGRSFRAPTNNDLYSTTIISASQSSTGFLTTQGNPDMQPEHGLGSEVGGEWRITPKYKVVVTYYRTDLTDLIYTKNVSSALTERINAGDAYVQGLELTGEARLLSWLTLSGLVTNLSTEITKNDADATSVGKRLTNAPPHMAGLDAVVRLQKLTTSLTVSYVGKPFALAGNTDVFTGVPGSADGYTVAHAKASYRLFKGIAANLSVNNLANREYNVFYRMPSRNATLELAWTF
ncbi:MAG: TonB-dependent receptor, partial [Vicinamibacterales bacterium]